MHMTGSGTRVISLMLASALSRTLPWLAGQSWPPVCKGPSLWIIQDQGFNSAIVFCLLTWVVSQECKLYGTPIWVTPTRYRWNTFVEKKSFPCQMLTSIWQGATLCSLCQHFPVSANIALILSKILSQCNSTSRASQIWSQIYKSCLSIPPVPIMHHHAGARK